MSAPEIKSNHPARAGYVRVTSADGKGGPAVSNSVAVTIGDQVIPVTSATIRMRPGRLIEIELETTPEFVDVEALQKDTELIIKKEG